MTAQFSTLEIYVYDEEQDNLYAHHDIPLPVFPLCLQWMDFTPAHSATSSATPGAEGHVVAVGTFAPYIEVWDLNVLDGLEPVATLGPTDDSSPYTHPEGHKDAVMALAWNRLQRNVIASASADQTVCLWDLGSLHEKPILKTHHHHDKVQALAWHIVEPALLLSASFDRNATVIDVRAPTSARSWSLEAEAESCAWDPHNSNLFVASAENGAVICFDARNSSDKALWTVKAHRKATSSIAFNMAAKGVLATGGRSRTATTRIPGHAAWQDIRYQIFGRFTDYTRRWRLKRQARYLEYIGGGCIATATSGCQGCTSRRARIGGCSCWDRSLRCKQ